MPTFPSSPRSAFLAWAQSHAETWENVAPSIGMTVNQAVAIKNQASEVAALEASQEAAKSAAKAATLATSAGYADLRTLVSGAVRSIRTFAEAQTKPDTVYVLAEIDPIAPPTPQPAPGKPEGFSVTLESSGAVTLSWDATDASASSGAFFTVARKLPGQSSFVSIGGAPGSTTDNRRPFYTDETIPASAASAGVQYIVQGRRGSRVGIASDALVVQFGIDGTAGGAFSVGGQSTAIRMAA
jgi:hypothetical protein